MTTTPTTCPGTWRERYDVPDDGLGGLAVLECGDCGELLVILKGCGTTHPAGTPIEVAVRDAFAARMAHA